MFRVIQEALSNVRKHSRCQNAHVDFDFTADTVTVAVRDDGIGFNLPDRPSHPTGTAKLGLMGMAERARLIGGQLTIDSAPGKGATVTLQAPV
jgi:two-component system sensor histidine kinase UhpB